jgi:hypothetical protein
VRGFQLVVGNWIRDARVQWSAAFLFAFLVVASLPLLAVAAAYSASASITPTITYVGDASGATFTLKVSNTGTTISIGAVELRRPSNA